MAEFDPDEFIRKGQSQQFDPDKFIGEGKVAPDATDPGFVAGAARFGRGVATGSASAIDQIARLIPTVPGSKLTPPPKFAPPKDFPESAGKFIGEVAPSFAVPSLGLEGLVARGLRAGQARYLPLSMGAARSIPAAEKIGGAVLEGGARGGIAGAMTPGEDAETGAAAGAGVRGTGASVSAAVKALPPRLKNTISAIAAVGAAKSLGMPLWYAFMHQGFDEKSGKYMGSMFNQLYNANLADIAARYFEKATRIHPAASAAAGVKLKDQANGR